MKNLKLNTVNLAGNISQVNIQNGQYGSFGNVTIAVDDGYYKKGQNGADGEWIDRTHFVEVKVDANNLKSLKANLQKGDQLQIEGKLIVEKWQDSQTGQNRSAMKVDCKTIVCHIPKAVIDAAKQAGVIQTGNQQNQQNQNPNGYQAQGNGQPNGSYQQMPNNRPNGYQQQQGY